ncbi:MAG: NAD(P)H-dependent glycerol-3-phosphate dehydrogenase, partial [Intestinibacter sp.]
IQEAVENTDLILHVTPSKFFRSTLKQYKDYITTQPVIICSKGFEQETLSTLSKVAEEEIPNVKIGALSGPSHAEEVCIDIPTAIVIASKDEDVQYQVQDTLMNENLRVYTSNDVEGVELGGALKNIIAFCAGIIAELNLGDNTFAALITRGLTELSRLGVAMGGEHNTFYGLSGLGDLIVTCLSEHSRNRKAGKCIGRGLSIEETKKEVGMTIESIDNIEVAYELAKKYNIEMPIVNTVYDVLYHNLKPMEAVTKLMTREKKCE